MQKVKLPELYGRTPPERLISFYRGLGWDGRSNLDPGKIRVHEDDLARLVMGEIERARFIACEACYLEVAVGVGMLWVDYGPSGGGSSPGWVELEEGWVE